MNLFLGWHGDALQDTLHVADVFADIGSARIITQWQSGKRNEVSDTANHAGKQDQQRYLPVTVFLTHKCRGLLRYPVRRPGEWHGAGL